MNYKVQDVLRIVIPGLYLFFAIFVLLYIMDYDGKYMRNGLIDLLKTPFANTIAVFLPFGGFIVGYHLNVVASGFERIMYETKLLKRPSLHILQKEDNEYYVDNIEEIFKILGYKNFNEENARLAFRKAKIYLKWDDMLENFYLQSIMSRNMLVAHFLVTFAVLILTFCNASCIKVTSLVVLGLITLALYNNWRRRTFLYVERVFAEVKRRNDKNQHEEQPNLNE